jgi:hypothetical protein
MNNTEFDDFVQTFANSLSFSKKEFIFGEDFFNKFVGFFSTSSFLIPVHLEESVFIPFVYSFLTNFAYLENNSLSSLTIDAALSKVRPFCAEFARRVYQTYIVPRLDSGEFMDIHSIPMNQIISKRVFLGGGF